MDDAAVARRGDGAGMGFGLEQQHFAAGQRQRARHREADHARTDDHAFDPIRHIPNLPNLLTQLQDFARIHDAVRIEGLLDAPHEIELHRVGVTLELEHLELPDAVLGAKSCRRTRCTKSWMARFAFARRPAAGTTCVPARWLMLKCRLPSPRCPYGDQHALRNVLFATQAPATLDEARHLRDGHRDVVLEAGAVLALRLGDGFAQPPERFALALAERDGGVGDPAGLVRAPPSAFSSTASSGSSGARGRQLAQHVPRRRRRRADRRRRECAAVVRSTPMRGMSSNELTQSPLASRSAPSSDTAASGSRTATKAVARELQRRIQLEAGGGDDAERAFRAEEQRLDVVAGVVLAQPGERVRARGRRPAPPRDRAPARAPCRSG